MTFQLDQFRLDGKVAVVTGAGGRGNSIGRAYAMGLAAAGASVVVADIVGAGAKAVAQEIIDAGGKAIGIGVDITDPAQVAAAADAAKAAYGGVDILVNNAALMVETFERTTIHYLLEDWNRLFAVNVTGALLMAQAFAPLMIARGGGRIVNQVSGGAYPPTTVYGITKIALVGLTTNLAYELGPKNITVNAIAPGYAASDAGKSLTNEDKPAWNTALRFKGEPDELVGPLLMLCSGAGSWMSGQVLHVDGGWIIRP